MPIHVFKRKKIDLIIFHNQFVLSDLFLDPGKEKIAGKLPSKSSRKFAGVVIATCGLPARGKSHIGHALARRLNWNGMTTKGKYIHVTKRIGTNVLFNKFVIYIVLYTYLCI